jgi:hypothetical protein
MILGSSSIVFKAYGGPAKMISYVPLQVDKN